MEFEKNQNKRQESFLRKIGKGVADLLFRRRETSGWQRKGEKVYLPEQYRPDHSAIVHPLREGVTKSKKGEQLDLKECLPRRLDQDLWLTFVSSGFGRKRRKHKLLKPVVDEDNLEISSTRFHTYILEEVDGHFAVLKSGVVDTESLNSGVNELMTIGAINDTSGMKLEKVVFVQDVAGEQRYDDSRQEATGSVRHAEWAMAKKLYDINHEVSHFVLRSQTATNKQ